MGNSRERVEKIKQKTRHGREAKPATGDLINRKTPKDGKANEARERR